VRSWKQVWHLFRFRQSRNPTCSAGETDDLTLILHLAQVIEQDQRLTAACAVHVYVLEGHVTLCGQVASEEVLAQLLERIGAIPGVRSVKSSVHVLPPSFIPA
jgi:hypothetical protein